MNKPSAQHQAQNSVSMPQNNNLDEIDQGCFKYYKIVLYIFLAFGCIDIAAMIYLLTKYKDLAGYYILAIVLQGFLLSYVAIQLQAIKQRDLGKATLALIGFVIYLVLCPLFSLGFPFAMWGHIDLDIVNNFIISLVSFILFVLIGSIKVYLSLKERQSDGYRNINNVAQNGITV